MQSGNHTHWCRKCKENKPCLQVTHCRKPLVAKCVDCTDIVQCADCKEWYDAEHDHKCEEN